MITVQTKLGPVDIDESMCGPAIKNHTPALKVESKSDWKHVKKLAEGIKQWWAESNNNFEGAWKSGYAIHHAQVEPYADPFNFFVVDEKLTRKEWARDIAKKDRSVRDITNIIFPDQVIYNPEIITATQTFLDDAIDKRTGRRYKRGTPNVMKYPEGCMSYGEQTRSPKKVDRFYRIKVRYQIVKKRLLLPDTIETVEEWCQGLKAHIFQHECDHSIGYDIVHGFGEKKFLTVEERERENGYTRKEVEEFTAKRVAEIEEKVQEKGMCILQSVTNGRYYRCPTNLEELPDGFLEPDVIEIYDGNGNIKEPFNTVPMYTDPSAHREDVCAEEGAQINSVPFNEVKPKKKKNGDTEWTANMTRKKVLEAVAGYEPSRIDGCYYLHEKLFFELAGKLHHGNPNVEYTKENILELYPKIEDLGFTVHGMVFLLSKRK